jgi:hypothetical protein
VVYRVQEEKREFDTKIDKLWTNSKLEEKDKPKHSSCSSKSDREFQLDVKEIGSLKETEFDLF